MPKIKIRTILDRLKEATRRRLLSDHSATDASELARKYRGNWVKLIAELKPAELRRALSSLGDESLRVAVYHALKHQPDQFASTSFKGGITQPLYVREVMNQLCGWKAAPRQVKAETFTALTNRLDELGIEVLSAAGKPIREGAYPGRDDKIRLRRRFWSRR